MAAELGGESSARRCEGKEDSGRKRRRGKKKTRFTLFRSTFKNYSLRKGRKNQGGKPRTNGQRTLRDFAEAGFSCGSSREAVRKKRRGDEGRKKKIRQVEALNDRAKKGKRHWGKALPWKKACL